MSAITDYGRVERAIEFIAAHAPGQPSLSDVAGHVGLSEFHFQRLFARWAGITPKRFAQFLTIEYAKQLLSRSPSLLSVSYASGLTGPGRLHDLFVSIEAMTPGEYRSNGDGITIDYGVYDSPFGEMLLAVTQRGICCVHFDTSNNSIEQRIAALMSEWPDATVRRSASAGREYVDQIFQLDASRHASGGRIPLYVRGTNFQVNVWRALLRIPAGAALTYSQLAELAGTPDAVRAVGTAVGRNPLAFIIPCHRVLRKSGEFGNYSGGPARKQAMLAWESAHSFDTEAALIESR
jgi:AraC family transcriptional regulator of adaptative response/methylated-DNA-[protein]-cysteine methyltransferase